MKTITIRGIEPELAEKLKAIATDQNKSLNQLVLEFIKKNLGVEKEKKYSREYNDLDNLFGSWDESQFNAIQNKITQERRIDEDIWK